MIIDWQVCIEQQKMYNDEKDNDNDEDEDDNVGDNNSDWDDWHGDDAGVGDKGEVEATPRSSKTAAAPYLYYLTSYCYHYYCKVLYT